MREKSLKFDTKKLLKLRDKVAISNMHGSKCEPCKVKDSEWIYLHINPIIGNEIYLSPFWGADVNVDFPKYDIMGSKNGGWYWRSTPVPVDFVKWSNYERFPLFKGVDKSTMRKMLYKEPIDYRVKTLTKNILLFPVKLAFG